MAKKRVHVWVEGMVQGVFFRAFTRDTAFREGLSGWVKNLPDGRVEAVFEGEEGAVARAVAAVREGPPASRVTGVREAEEPPEGVRGFEIRHY